jgi:hypothetical protein
MYRIKLMALIEIDLSVRAVLDVDDPKDIDAIKALAKLYEIHIMVERSPYKVEVLPFNPAAWDFKESPVNSDKTIGELYEQQQLEILK